MFGSIYAAIAQNPMPVVVGVIVFGIALYAGITIRQQILADERAAEILRERFRELEELKRTADELRKGRG